MFLLLYFRDVFDVLDSCLPIGLSIPCLVAFSFIFYFPVFLFCFFFSPLRFFFHLAGQQRAAAGVEHGRENGGDSL